MCVNTQALWPVYSHKAVLAIPQPMIKKRGSFVVRAFLTLFLTALLCLNPTLALSSSDHCDTSSNSWTRLAKASIQSRPWIPLFLFLLIIQGDRDRDSRHPNAGTDAVHSLPQDQALPFEERRAAFSHHYLPIEKWIQNLATHPKATHILPGQEHKGDFKKIIKNVTDDQPCFGIIKSYQRTISSTRKNTLPLMIQFLENNTTVLSGKSRLYLTPVSFKIERSSTIHHSPVVHFDSTLDIRFPLQHSRLKLFFWLEPTTPKAPTLHWVLMKPSQMFKWSRGFVRISFQKNRINVLFVQTGIPKARLPEFLPIGVFRALGDHFVSRLSKLISTGE